MPTVDEPVRVLIVNGSSEEIDKELLLKSNIARLHIAGSQLGATVQTVRLCEQPFSLRSARRGSKFIPPELQELEHAVRWSEVMICTTPTQWLSDGLWFKLFTDQILSPLEEGGLEKGFECWGKVGALSLICDDDGAAAVSARLLHTLVHMGIWIPGWASHYTNALIPPGKTENNWQRKPEIMLPILLWQARCNRGLPSFQELLARLPENK